MTTVAATTQLTEMAVPDALEPPGQGPTGGRIGLVALATDVNSEADLRRMAPTGIEIFTNRVTNANPTTIENLRAMAGDISRAACGILPGDDLDVLVYGCTSGTVANGEAEIIKRLQARGADIPCTTPITAAKAAFAAFGARRVSVLTPYLKSVNQEMLAFFEDNGLEVINMVGFGLADDNDMTAVTPRSIEKAAFQVCHADADLLFISCTALRAAQAVYSLENILNKPVVTSNQAIMWHALELIGKPYQVNGYGLLFDKRLN